MRDHAVVPCAGEQGFQPIHLCLGFSNGVFCVLAEGGDVHSGVHGVKVRGLLSALAAGGQATGQHRAQRGGKKSSHALFLALKI
ncbi:hypothetical protein SDC9_190360 [bioreactor metagenome]|uniref:Uncharacterized protein n=1 Tax=bioreactor metagenome TaxID=1076179 RepID=A0A645HWG3_9ZZZZ